MSTAQPHYPSQKMANKNSHESLFPDVSGLSNSWREFQGNSWQVLDHLHWWLQSLLGSPTTEGQEWCICCIQVIQGICWEPAELHHKSTQRWQQWWIHVQGMEPTLWKGGHQVTALCEMNHTRIRLQSEPTGHLQREWSGVISSNTHSSIRYFC